MYAARAATHMKMSWNIPVETCAIADVHIGNSNYLNGKSLFYILQDLGLKIIYGQNLGNMNLQKKQLRNWLYRTCRLATDISWSPWRSRSFKCLQWVSALPFNQVWFSHCKQSYSWKDIAVITRAQCHGEFKFWPWSSTSMRHDSHANSIILLLLNPPVIDMKSVSLSTEPNVWAQSDAVDCCPVQKTLLSFFLSLHQHCPLLPSWILQNVPIISLYQGGALHVDLAATVSLSAEGEREDNASFLSCPLKPAGPLRLAPSPVVMYSSWSLLTPYMLWHLPRRNEQLHPSLSPRYTCFLHCCSLALVYIGTLSFLAGAS